MPVAAVRWLYVAGVTMWLASLVLPAVEINETTRLAGYQVFAIGIDALRAGIPGWLANPLSLGAVIAGLFGRFRLATALAGSAALLGFSSLSAPASARADGLPLQTVVFETGFFLWLAAFSVILATSAWAWQRARRTPERA